MTALLIAFPAVGQPCFSYDSSTRHLAETYQERPLGAGLAPQGVVTVLTAESGSWTVILTMPDGCTVPLASGEHWETVPVVKGRGT